MPEENEQSLSVEARLAHLEEGSKILAELLFEFAVETSTLRMLLVRHGRLNHEEIEQEIEKAKKDLLEKRARELDPETILRLLTPSKGGFLH